MMMYFICMDEFSDKLGTCCLSNGEPDDTLVLIAFYKVVYEICIEKGLHYT